MSLRDEERICPNCRRRIFGSGGHAVDCLETLVSLPVHPGYYDREPVHATRFVSVWDEVTYFNDGDEGDRG